MISEFLRIRYLIGLCLSILTGCAPRPDVAIVAHRGASYDAPENTIAAFELAWQQGADIIEGDFYLSADDEIVCIHDANTKRTAGVELIVAETKLADLKQLDVGSWKGNEWQGEKIPTIQEVFEIVPDGKQMLIEVKTGPEIVPYLKKAVLSSGLKPEQMKIISFQQSVIAEAKKQIPQLSAFWLTSYRRDEDSGQWKPDIRQVLEILEQTGADGLDSKAHESIDQDFVAALRTEHMGFHVWTVDDVETAQRFIALGTESITTNRPQWLRQKLGL